eukprot:746754-Pyramimonas_sp.AAC.1
MGGEVLPETGNRSARWSVLISSQRDAGTATDVGHNPVEDEFVLEPGLAVDPDLRREVHQLGCTSSLTPAAPSSRH